MLKNIIIFALVIGGWQAFVRYQNHVPADANFSHAQGKTVVMYSTSWCGYCRKARNYFNDNRVHFAEYDIEKSRKGFEEHKALGGGGIPVVVIDGQVIRGYNPSKMTRLLTAP